MKKVLSIFKFIILFFLLTSCNSNSQEEENNYDFYHGTRILDEYKYLENLKDSSVIDWFRKQRDSTSDILKNIPGKKRLIELQKSFSNNTKEDVSNIRITSSGAIYYLKRNLDKDDYPNLYYRKTLNSKEELIYDPADYKRNELKKYYINYYKVSWDEKKIVLSFSEKGKEISEMRFLEIKTKELLPIIMDMAVPSYGGVYWLPNNSGVTYLQIPKENLEKKDLFKNTRVVLQTLDDSSPKTFFSKKNNSKLGMKSEDIPIVLFQESTDKYSIAAIAGATPYHDYYVSKYEEQEDINKIEWKSLFKKENKVTSFYQDNDSIIYLTSENASNFKICKTSILSPNIENPKILVEEPNDKVVKSFRVINDLIVYTTTKNGVESELFIVDSKGIQEKVDLPMKAGRISIEDVNKFTKDITLGIRGWLQKDKRLIFNLESKNFEDGSLIKSDDLLDVSNITVEELEVKSHDGAMVPLSLIYKNGLKRDGSNPAFMIGYGSYGTSLRPRFSEKIMTWIHEGGIYVIAHVRGGGEKGDKWYKGGFKETKSNTWKDFIACAEFIVDRKYTSKNKLAINGVSAGGITVGRAMTERPDLFAVVIANVGFMNAIKLESHSNGANNTKEFGTIKTKEGFQTLLEMDSYNNISKGKSYPATLLTTGMNDFRVPPWDPAKFVARLQDYNSSGNPILLKVDFESGHGSSNSKTKRLNDTADVLAFAFWQTGHPNYQPKKIRSF